MRAPRWFVIGLAILAVVGLGVRVGYTLEVSRDLAFVGDAKTYHLLGENLAEGRGYIRPDGDGEVPTAEFPPVFPAVLAVASTAGLDSITGQKVLTSFFGMATIVAVGLLGRRVAGSATGLVAAGLAALYPMMIQVDGALMAESLYLPLVTTTLLLTYRAIDRPSWIRWSMAGVVAGLAALTRAEALLFTPLLLLPEALRHGGSEWKARLVSAAAASGAVLLVLTPWLVRNVATFDSVIPVSNNTGTLLAGANCDRAYQGTDRGLWYLGCVTAIETVGPDEAASMSRYRSAGISYMNEHRSELPGVFAVRVARTLGVYDPTGQIKWESLEGRNQRWLTAGHRMFLALAALAVAGAVVLARRAQPMWPLLAPIVLVVVMSAISYGNQRFRIAAEPSVVILAAVALTAAGSTLRRRVMEPSP